MRILVTGSRNWTNADAVDATLSGFTADVPPDEHITIVHGACPTGADAIAGKWARDADNTSEERHPANWNLHGKAAGPIRNKEMVNLGADICIGFPTPESRGTVHCMRAAEEADMPVYNAATETLISAPLREVGKGPAE